MAGGRAMDGAAARLSSRRGVVLFPVLLLALFVCYASATTAPASAPPTTAATIAPSVISTSSVLAGGGEEQSSGSESSSLVLLAIICGAVAVAGGGGVLLCLLCQNRRKKDDEDSLIGGKRGSGSFSRMRKRERLRGGKRVAAADDGDDDGDGDDAGGEGMPAPSTASSAAASRSASLALLTAPFGANSAWHAATGQEEFDVEVGGDGSGTGDANICSSSELGARYSNPLYGKGSMERGPARGAAATASPSPAGDIEGDEDQDMAGMKAAGRRCFDVGADAGDRFEAFPERAMAPTTMLEGGTSSSGNATLTGDDDSVGVGNNTYSDGERGATAAPRRSSAPGPRLDRSDTTGKKSDNDPKKKNLLRRHSSGNDPLGSAQRSMERNTSAASSSFAAFSVLKGAERVVAGAQSLSPLEAFVPGAREVSGVIAGLARLAAASHKGDAKDMRRRVRWCRAVVLTLNRARAVLGKATQLIDTDTKRLALEAVQEPVECMVEIVQSYKNRQVVSEVFSSNMFRLRQREADDAILTAERYLSVLEDNPGTEEKASKVVLAKAERKRRLRQAVLLDKVDLPATSLDIVEDEVLGLGGFGTVFLADLGGGMNAAAKVVMFEQGRGPCGRDDRDGSDSGNSNENGGAGQQGQHQPVEEGNGSPSMPCEHDVEMADVRLDELSDQKEKRRAFVAEAKRCAAEARAEARQRMAFCRELEVMKRLRGPHTVHIYGGVTTLGKDRLVVVMEFMPGGDLLLKLRKGRSKPLEDKVLRQIVGDVCSGMAFLHRQAFVHGDLKSSKILFDAKGRAKVADVCTSLWTQCSNRAVIYTAQPGGLMSLPWTAPEVLRRRPASSESDVYSFGVVVWECLSRKLPWDDVTDVRRLSQAVKRGERPQVPADAPPDLADLVRACWAGDPASRPALESVLANLNLR